MYGIFFIVHKNDVFAKGELSFLFATIAIVFLAMGSGRFSLDKFFRRN
ncbi:MAG: hypothetical protein LDLANPLL_00157 [Turneriella sp.]|nr:hypothetical protein [Turneriella sp.]